MNQRHYLDNLSLLHLNIRSLRNNVDIVEAEFSDYDILCFTESHLNTDISNNDITIDSHSKIHRNDRLTQYGGGIIIYTENNIQTVCRSDLETEDIEIVILEVNIPNNKILLCCLYRPPNSTVDYWKKLNNVLDNISNLNFNIIITGELNTDLLTN